MPHTEEEWAARCPTQKREDAACLVMLRAHTLGEFLECPQFCSTTLSALFEYCKLRSLHHQGFL